MTAGLAAGCGSGSSGSSSSGKDGDPVTLTVFSQLANYSGVQSGWIADILLEKFNVILNIVPDLNGTLQTRMESGDLGDIVVFGDNGTQYQNAIDAGLLYDWNEDDLLEEYGPYIKENMSHALEYNASYSGGTTYGFGHSVATSSENLQNFFYTWDIRWDLYKEIGYPEVNELEDLIDVFKQMKEVCPTDENGNPTYAASLWPDWDGDMVMYVKSTATAYYGYDELGIGLYDPSTGNYYDCLAEDGPYLRALRFYNQLYQNGLLDPDSMTATYDTMSEKVQSGGVFFSIFDYAGSLIYNTEEHVAQGKRMCSLTPTNATPIVYGMDVLGGNRLWCIGAKTEYPELCMEVINWLATPEGYMTMLYGPQGVCWDYDEDGYTYFTEFGKTCQLDKDGTSMADVGYSGTFHDGELQINNITWANDAVNPDSNGETFNWKNWKSNLTEAESDIEQDWRDFTGCDSVQEYMASGNYNVSPASTFVGSTKDEEFQTKWTQTTNCITTNSWNAIYANSDEEFDQIVDKMITEANSYYYQECLEWSQNEAARRYECEQQVR
jgi:multiple sugar transport system substrate-binding protein/putative aldouronate transport system substrate-binding protein